MKKTTTSIALIVFLAFAGVLSLTGAISKTKTPVIIPAAVLDKNSVVKPKFELNPIVDFDAYLRLASEVKQMRATRLVSLDTFMFWGQQSGVVILDTRSDSLYNAKHIRGAIHLNFADFTQEALAALIPDKSTRILIYCNNNFKELRIEPAYFSSKMVRIIPKDAQLSKAELPPAAEQQNVILAEAGKEEKPLTLALNIPTFINLVGYGYSNVYELGEQVFVFDSRLKFEGTAMMRQ